MPDRELSLVGHLSELRKRLFYCIVVFFLSACVSIFFSKTLLLFLRFPAQGIINKLAFFSPQEVAVVYLKISLACGFIISLPLILLQGWKFIQPALDGRKNKHLFVFLFFTITSFLLGCAFGYFILLPFSLNFLIGLGQDEFVPVISISKYISFVLALVLGCALAFLMPVIFWLLSSLGIVNHVFLRNKRKYAVVIIFVLAAVITPTTDPFNMCLLALPMLVLYEISIWVSRLSARKV